MNKALTITIAGQIFQIEEDAYAALRSYLEQIQRYFSTYEDSREITFDIELRLAEIFRAKLRDGGRDAVIMADVSGAIASLGTVEQIAGAIAEESGEEPHSTHGAYQSGSGSTTGAGSTAGNTGGPYTNTGQGYQVPPLDAEPPRLYCVIKGRMVGGVLAGLADYFYIDPSWVRILFILLFFGVWIFPALPGIMTVGYLLLWLLLPKKMESHYRPTKRLYRNPIGKTIAGVANGIATYLDIDVTLVRVLFFILAFAGGVGIGIYLILWAATPSAYTPKQQMELKGTPFTLSNLEGVLGNVQKAVSPKMLNPLWRLLGRALGLLLITLGVAMMAGSAIPLLTGEPGEATYISIDGRHPLAASIPPWATVSLYSLIIIPALMLVLVGFRLVTGVRFLRAWMMAVASTLWVVALVATLAFYVPFFIKEAKKMKPQTQVQLSIPAQHPAYTLVGDATLEAIDEEVEFELVPAYNDSVKIVQFSSRFSVLTSPAALQVGVVDSVITMRHSDHDVTDDDWLGDLTERRRIRMYMPIDVRFRFNRDLANYMNNTQLYETLQERDWDSDDLPRCYFYFDKQGSLQVEKKRKRDAAPAADTTKAVKPAPDTNHVGGGASGSLSAQPANRGLFLLGLAQPLLW